MGTWASRVKQGLNGQTALDGNWELKAAQKYQALSP